MAATARFPGWSVVWAAFAIGMFSSGVGTYGPSIYLQTLHASRGWPISWVSAAVTTHFLTSAAVVVSLPELHRRFGIARATAGGGVLIALGICAWGNVRELWQLFPAAALSGSGFALIGGAAIAAMITRWFDRDRPKALSMALNGASVGGVVFAPLWVFLIASIGFQWAAITVGVVMACIIVALALRFLRLGPADFGLSPDGDPATALAARHPPAAPLSRAALLRNRRFRALSLPFALGLFAQIGVVSHLVARLALDLGKDGAAAALSLATACAVLGRIALGWTIGGRDRRLAAALNFLTQASGVFLLALADSPPFLILGCILFGLGIGNLFSLPPLIAQTEFEPADVGTVVALVTAINQTAFGLAPAVLGVLYDVAAGYTVPFALAWILQIVAAAAVVTSRANGMRAL